MKKEKWMKTNLCVCVSLWVFARASSECTLVRSRIVITTTKGSEMSRRNASGGSIRIYRASKE